MTFAVNQIVKNTRGDVGIVAGFNGQPCLIVFQTFTMKPSQFNADLQTKSKGYEITHIYDGSAIEDFSKVFSKKFKIEDLNLVWESPTPIE